MINRLNRLAARIFGSPIEMSAYQAQVLCPAQIQSVPPAIYLKEHLVRVKGVHHMSSMAYEQERLNQKTVQHGATMLYQIGEARLFRGGIWAAKHKVMTRLLKPKDAIYPIHLERAVLTDSDITQHYFGHWLRDFLPSSMVGNADMPSLAFRKPGYHHAAGYGDLLGLNTLYGNSGKVGDLYLLDDFAQNSFKIERYLTLRQRLKQALSPVADCAFTGVFMARGQTGVKRSLSNEEAVIEHLVKRGFDIVYPESMAVEDLMRRLWNAPMLISVEGSAFNHALYSIALNGSYLVLQPPHLFNHVHKGICDAMNRPYGFYVCQPTQNPDEFYVDSMDDLDKVIDGLHNESSKRVAVQ